MANFGSFRPKKRISEEVALQRLETLCAAGEHCRHELMEKLRKWGTTAEEAARILKSLEENRFLDDSRFASAFVRDKLLYNHWGRIKIGLALRAKRIDPDIIDEALDEIAPEEYEEIAREFLAAKAKTVKEGNCYDGRTRLYRYGLSRGFESPLVARIVKATSTWGEEED